MNEKKFVKIVLLFTLSIILFGAILTIIIDPYFHYHKPLSVLAYQIDNERYQNNGIVRHFEYDTIITGTSMTENFKTSECNNLFGGNAIKVPLNGGHYNEVDRLLKIALDENPDVEYVFRSLDYSMMNEDKDVKRLGEENFPTYLYDKNYFNDVNYVLNKTVLYECVKTVLYTLSGGTTTTFDEYVNWSDDFEYGKDSILDNYVRTEKNNKIVTLTDEERVQIIENISQNVEMTIKENPEVTFYLFIPPYSVLYWDECNQAGMVSYRVEIERIVIERLLEYENVRLFSFTNNYELVCNLNNYKDAGHYGEWVNSDMLEWMKDGKYELNKENYEEYLEEIELFYSNYDYESIYED